MLRYIKIACITVVGIAFIGLTVYASMPVVEKYNMKRMDDAKEQQIKELYQIEKEDLPTINRKSKIEAFDVSEKRIVLALDDNSIIEYDLDMNPIARYTYKGNTNVEGIQVYDGCIYVFFVRYEECFVLEKGGIKVYEWTNESMLNDAANEMIYDEKTANDFLYYLSTKENKKKNSMNGKYNYFIRVNSNGQSEVLYEADRDSDNFSFANITEPLIISAILIINLVLIGTIRKKRK